MDDTFRQQRKPAVERKEEKPERESSPILDNPNLPPQLQQALRKNAERLKQQTTEEPAGGPRLAFTGNARLDELLAGIKETVYQYEEVELPSRGRFYADGTAPNNGTIHVRCMTGEEEQILATPRYIKKGQAINMIFKNCVREAIAPEKLLTIDRTWLLIYLRGISYTPDYEVEVRCTECNRKFSTVIDLDAMMVNKCPDNFGPEQLTDTLPKSGYKISYRLPTGKDENLIQEHRDLRIRKNTDGGMDDTWNYRAALLITDLEGLTDQIALQALVARLPIQDVAYIRSLLTEPPFGVETKVSIICPECSEEFQVEMPMDTSFFFPKPRKVNPTPA